MATGKPSGPLVEACGFGAGDLAPHPSPRRAASIVAMSIFLIVIMASMARFAAARSGSVVDSSSARGVICQEKPQRSLHQPQALSWPPLPTMAFQLILLR